MYLLDTNIWLERLLDQDKSEEVGQLLDQISSDQLCITDFSWHSIGVILHRLGQHDAFLRFTTDLFVYGSVELMTLEAKDMSRLVAAVHDFGLDFDDAYQYVAAGVYNMKLISFDKDFDRTERGRLTPGDIITSE